MVFTSSPQKVSDAELQKIEELETVHDKWDETFVHLLTDEDFSERAFDGIDVSKVFSVPVTKMSPKMRKRLRNFADSSAAAEISLLADKMTRLRPCAEVASIPIRNAASWFPKVVKNGLFATRSIKSGEFIISSIGAFLSCPQENGMTMNGLTRPQSILFDGLQQDFHHYEVVGSSGSRKRRRSSSFQWKQRKFSFVDSNSNSDNVQRKICDPYQYNSDDEESLESTSWPKYIICIDMSTASKEAKSIRRNCKPNCVIRYVIINRRINIFITAAKDVKAGEELTLPHDFNYYNSMKMLQCAHPFDANNLCKFEKHRQSCTRERADLAPGRAKRMKIDEKKSDAM